METADIVKLVAAVAAAGGIGAGGGYFGGDDSAMLDALTSSHRAQVEAFADRFAIDAKNHDLERQAWQMNYDGIRDLAVRKNEALQSELKECSRELLAEVRGN